MYTIGDKFLWCFTILFLFFCFIFDLVLNRSIFYSMKKSVMTVLLWIFIFFIAIFFIWLYLKKTKDIFLENVIISLLTGYLVEKVLIIDNLFIWIVIFNYFKIPVLTQFKIINLGILGVIISRIFMLFFGSLLINKLPFLMYLFGFLLLYLGYNILFKGYGTKYVNNNFILKLVCTFFKVTNITSKNFFIRRENKTYITYSFLALVSVITSDIIFSFDSIPVLIAINVDPFIIVTSNLFSILGISNMYFLIINLSKKFFFLNYGISIILIFIGIKMIISHFIKVSACFSFIFIFLVLLTTIILSFFYKK